MARHSMNRLPPIDRLKAAAAMHALADKLDRLGAQAERLQWRSESGERRELAAGGPTSGGWPHLTSSTTVRSIRDAAFNARQAARQNGYNPGSTQGSVHEGCGGIWRDTDTYLVDRCSHCGEGRA